MKTPRIPFHPLPGLLLSTCAAALLAMVAPLPAQPGAASDPAQQALVGQQGEVTRRENFKLYPRNQRWESKRQQLGTVRLVGKSEYPESASLIESELILADSSTHIQRTQRYREGEIGTYVYREWRPGGNASPAGRSLVMEMHPALGAEGPALVREWAGGDVRHQDLAVPPTGLTLMTLVEQERGIRAGQHDARLVPLFEDQECSWTNALVVRTPIGLGLGTNLRIVDVFPGGGGRHSRWIFRGTQLLGFLHGQYEAIAIPAQGPIAVALDPDL